jgi:hypothetical protein
LEKNFFEDLDSLPPEAQRQVSDYVALLKQRYGEERAEKKTRKGRLTDEAFVGMWRDREDLTDSRQWVREMRKREWHDR